MNKPSKDKLVNDIENRLDDFFEENAAPENPGPSASSIEKLKSVVLSIDWEITDKCLQDLTQETNALLPAFANDRPAHALLRMLQALGRYIQKRKAQAHPDAIKRIMSVYKSFENVTQGQITDERTRKRLIAKEIEAFKSLKAQVENQRKASHLEAEEQEDKAAPNAFVDHQRLELAMNAVEKKINAEVSELKAKLARLQSELDSLRSS